MAASPKKCSEDRTISGASSRSPEGIDGSGEAFRETRESTRSRGGPGRADRIWGEPRMSQPSYCVAQAGPHPPRERRAGARQAAGRTRLRARRGGVSRGGGVRPKGRGGPGHAASPVHRHGRDDPPPPARAGARRPVGWIRREPPVAPASGPSRGRGSHGRNRETGTSPRHGRERRRHGVPPGHLATPSGAVRRPFRPSPPSDDLFARDRGGGLASAGIDGARSGTRERRAEDRQGAA